MGQFFVADAAPTDRAAFPALYLAAKKEIHPFALEVYQRYLANHGFAPI
nr:hypothetical protein [uncultured Selenomonas sp.]